MYKMQGADGKEYGPFTQEEIRRWIAEGRANSQTQILAPGASTWQRAGEMAEFSDLTGGAFTTVPSAGGPMGPKTNALAIASLVCGILAVTLGMCCCYGLPFNLLGVIFGIIALSQISKNGGLEKGRGMAMWGIGLSIASFVLGIAMLFFGLALSSSKWFQDLQHQL